MSDVFISYSRKDSSFAQDLTNALAKSQREVWIDWQNIPRATDWLNEIYRGIENADTFVFIVSQHSLASEICNYEIEHARKHNKRIIVLMRQEIDTETEKWIAGEWYNQKWESLARVNWDILKQLNWIFFTSDQAFDDEFRALLQALEQDLDHLRTHKRLLVRSLEWDRGGQNPSLLLNGDEINNAEKWLIQAGEKQPQPTTLQQNYIAFSRQNEEKVRYETALREKRIRQFQRASILLGLMVILSIIAVLFAGTQASIALLQVESANKTLTPAQASVNDSLTQVASGQTLVADAEEDAVNANLTLSSAQINLNANGTQIADAETQVALANMNVDIAYATLTPARIALNDSETQVALAEEDVANSATQR